MRHVNKISRPRCFLDFFTRLQAKVKNLENTKVLKIYHRPNLVLLLPLSSISTGFKSFYIIESLIFLESSKLLTSTSFSMELVRVLRILLILRSKSNTRNDFRWKLRKPINSVQACRHLTRHAMLGGQLSPMLIISGCQKVAGTKCW